MRCATPSREISGTHGNAHSQRRRYDFTGRSPFQFRSLPAFLFLAFLVLPAAPRVSAQITLAIGQADAPATPSSSAQTWPGCAAACLPANPAYVVFPGATRRIWTNVCSGPNAWGGTGFPSEIPNCAYPSDIRVAWTVNSGACAMSPSPSSVFATLSVPAGAATQLCTITATTLAEPPASETLHVLIVKTAPDNTRNSASMALHYCGAAGAATCVHVLPFYEVLYQGQYAALQAFVSGKVNTGVTWSVSPGTGGLAILNGTTNRSLALLGAAAGTYTVTATSAADGSASGSARIIVTGNSFAGQRRAGKVIPVDCTAVGSGAAYEVTDAASFARVPWNTLAPGDTVRIHAGTYAAPFQIQTSGTATQPIRVCGVPDANGNLPVLTGANAGPGNVIPPQQPYGMVVVQNSGYLSVNCARAANCSEPPEPDPHSIVIEGLAVRSAYSAYARSGGAARWQIGAASFRIQGRDVVIRGNEITDSSNGVFALSQTVDIESRMVRRLTVEGNAIYGNGEIGSFSQHNNYLQGDLLLFQFNWVGAVRSGAAGSSVKVRSAGAALRYNYVQGSARVLDVNELQDWQDFSVPQNYYADNVPQGAPSDPTGIADVAAVAEHLQSDYVYGNIFDNNARNGMSAGFPIHYFPDVFGNREKGGTCYLYYNTDRELHDASGAYAGFTHLIDSSRTGGVPQVWPQTRLTDNAIDLECATAQCASGKFSFSLASADQDIIGLDRNWITAGWNATPLGAGPSPAWSACCGSPTNNGESCYQSACSDASSSNHIMGESNLIGSEAIPFNETTFEPLPGSPLLNAAAPLPAAVSDMPPEFAYHPDTQSVTPRADLRSNLPATIGALDAGRADSSAPAATPIAPGGVKAVLD